VLEGRILFGCVLKTIYYKSMSIALRKRYTLPGYTIRDCDICERGKSFRRRKVLLSGSGIMLQRLASIRSVF
jgi:hypothetical protein